VTRLRRIEQRDRYFFVTTNLARGCGRLDDSERDIVLQMVALQLDKKSFWLFGYVVMPDHVHLLIRPRENDLSSAMRKVKAAAGTRIMSRRKKLGSLWQPKYFDHIIRRVRDFWEKLEYIHKNPVEAGLVVRPEDWRWSSYGAYAPGGKATVGIDQVDFAGDGDALLWSAF
jgi:putative transposase